MAQKIVSASQIFDGKKWLPKDSCLVLNENGRILDILNSAAVEDVAFYSGILCPGMVNAHVHTELAHLKGTIEQKTGLGHFLTSVISNRSHINHNEKLLLIEASVVEMLNNGVVAIGDIANTTDALPSVAKDRLHVRTFVEALGFNPTTAKLAFDKAMKVFDEWSSLNLQQHQHAVNLVPHSPYSVSQELFMFIKNALSKNAVQSIHNQEWVAENLMYLKKEGEAISFLKSLGINTDHFVASGKNSLPTYMHWMSDSHPLLLVHNTQTTVEDIQQVNHYNPDTWFCLCPNANIFIEDQLPNVIDLMNNTNQICLGTDGLSSNTQLSILTEMQTLKTHFPQLEWGTLLQWATFNGAAALGFSDEIGSFEIGKKPGLLHLVDIAHSSIVEVIA